MTELSRYIASKRKPPQREPATEKKRTITRQSRKRMKEDAIYNAVRDIWLEQNPDCCMCENHAQAVHHIVGGTAGRRRSLLNSDTWLGVCSPECHSDCESLPTSEQIKLKQRLIEETILRLKR